MSTRPATKPSQKPGGTLGTGRDVGRRLLRHHVPLALTSAVVLVLFMGLPTFDADARPHADITSGPFPQERVEREGLEMDHGEEQAGPMDMDHGGGQAEGLTLDLGEPGSRAFVSQLIVATGYVATLLLALTLLIGPANLLLRRRNPVSSYLRRDVGTWTAVFSVVHVILGLQAEKLRSGLLAFVDFFVADGRLLTNSFGWGNWTGLAATVLVVGLLVLSTDRSIRELKAKRWKNLQRLNYALFVLVVAHAFFYGALVQLTSPFALLLIVTVVSVVAGQTAGIWLWRRRNAHAPADRRATEEISHG